MLEYWWVVFAVMGLVLMVRLFSSKKLDQAMDTARETGEVAGIVAVIDAAAPKKQPNMWDQTIGALWQEYHRPAALALMVAAARRSDAPVIQFWLKNAMEVEPELAQEIFSEEFLETYFRADVASRCGRVSCCM